MSILGFIIITVFQFLSGLGLIALCGIDIRRGLLLPLSILIGVAIFSFVPFLLQLFYIPLTATNIFIALAITALLLNLRFQRSIQLMQQAFTGRFHISLGEVPFLLVIAFLVFVSVWRCFYYPPTPRDLTSGAEVIATYAVKEKTMINSVFTVNLESTNNQFKPPFITSLQIIYKYGGFLFGQVWLSTIFVFFTVFIYRVLKEKLHHLIAGFLVLAITAVPEMYAYTFMALFDYPNAVYFFLSVFFLVRYLLSGAKNTLVLSGILMAIATYIRSETLVLAALMLFPICWYHIKKWRGITKLAFSTAVFFIPAVLMYLVSVTIYINFYLPVPYQVEGLVNNNLLDVTALFNRFTQMNGKLIFSAFGLDLYGYFIFLFLLIIIFDHVWGDSFTPESGNWFYAVLVIYLGYPLLGYLLPLLDIDHSTKRGLFKIFPLMLFYMGTSTVLIKLSTWIRQWENGSGQVRTPAQTA